MSALLAPVLPSLPLLQVLVAPGGLEMYEFVGARRQGLRLKERVGPGGPWGRVCDGGGGGDSGGCGLRGIGVVGAGRMATHVPNWAWPGQGPNVCKVGAAGLNSD